MEKKNINQTGKKPYTIPTTKCTRIVHCRLLVGTSEPTQQTLKVESDNTPPESPQPLWGYRVGW